MQYFQIHGELDDEDMVIRVDESTIELRDINGVWTDVTELFRPEEYPTLVAAVLDLYSPDQDEDPDKVYVTEVPEREVLV